MWPIIMGILRRNAVYITLPVAGLVGFLGYHLEGVLSDRYTPYTPSVQERRAERLAELELNSDVTQKENLIWKQSVLERSLPPSLQKGT